MLNDFLDGIDDWRDHTSAPKDGTSIVVSQAGTPIGVFHWEDRPEVLCDSPLGKTMPPSWVGVYFMSDLEPMYEGDNPIGNRMFFVRGLDEPFMWRPLPQRPKMHEYDICSDS